MLGLRFLAMVLVIMLTVIFGSWLLFHDHEPPPMVMATISEVLSQQGLAPAKMLVRVDGGYRNVTVLYDCEAFRKTCGTDPKAGDKIKISNPGGLDSIISVTACPTPASH